MEFMGNDDVSAPADAMLVIPGGGYGAVCADREGYPIALAYMMQGMATFVLHYPVGAQIRHPLDPLLTASLALMHMRAHAAEYCIDPARVFAVGFSAGGHLAGSLASLWNDAELQALLGGCGELNRPTGAVLCYPVVTAGRHADLETFHNLLGTNAPAAAALERFALDRHVGAHSAPAFILHTMDDEMVPVENSLLLGMAYSAAGAMCELHIYPHGPHGVALANRVTWCGNPGYDDPAIARWVADSRVWMARIG